MKTKNSIYLILLVGIFLTDLYLVQIENYFRFITKALLIPTLALYFVSSKPKWTNANKAILIGLFFSWGGDIFLLFENLFIPGLICFLLTHISYIFYFAKLKGNKNSYLQQRPVMLLVIIAYLVELLYMLWPGLGALKIPVIVYAVVISTMFAMAAWQFEKIDRKSALLFIFGSFFFVLSDSILAIGKFLQPLALGGIWVMCTYVLAQWLIMQGVISFNQTTQVSLEEK